ncbi:hypothetical protein LEMLEM_LOCUS6235 [Lemmus lemmus]
MPRESLCAMPVAST